MFLQAYVFNVVPEHWTRCRELYFVIGQEQQGLSRNGRLPKNDKAVRRTRTAWRADPSRMSQVRLANCAVCGLTAHILSLVTVAFPA